MAQVIGTYCSCFLICRELMKAMADNKNNLFDRQILKLRRARAKKLGLEKFLYEILIDNLKFRLEELNKNFENSVVITPFLENFSYSIHNKSYEKAEDNEELDLKRKYDLIIHFLCLHWSNDPLGQLIQIKRSLNQGGMAVGYLFGENTLNELRKSFAMAEISLENSLSARVSPMMELKSLGDLLSKAGFRDIVTDLISQTVHYHSLAGLFSDLRRMGETNVLQKRTKSFLRRSTYNSMKKKYEEEFSNNDRKLMATFDIICFTGWKI